MVCAQAPMLLRLTYVPAYFVSLGLSEEEASQLHLHYYTQYGLALRGLTRHHDVGTCQSDSSGYPLE